MASYDDKALPQQTNGYDCRIHVLENLSLLLIAWAAEVETTWPSPQKIQGTRTT